MRRIQAEYTDASSPWNSFAPEQAVSYAQSISSLHDAGPLAFAECVLSHAAVRMRKNSPWANCRREALFYRVLRGTLDGCHRRPVSFPAVKKIFSGVSRILCVSLPMNTDLFLYIALPVISAFIGWLTNTIAVRMIFRPRLPIRVLGIEIVGLIPKRRADLARKIGETVEQELISHKDIHEVVSSPAFQSDILDAVMGRVDDFINDNLGLIPMVSLFLDGEAMKGIKARLRQELAGVIPDMIENMFEKVESRLDFKELIRRKIEGFDLARLESIIYHIASRELKAIEIFGAVLGCAVGLVQVAIVACTR
jgi:uncharacterized membrane protein YheB (UPF0754 family)